MPPPRQSPAYDHPCPSSPSEVLLIVQVLLIVGLSSWGFGGSLSWGPGVAAGLALLAIPILIARYQEGFPIGKLPFVPAALWTAFVIIAVFNPSHVIGELGWQPLANWKPWLPTTPDPSQTVTAALPWLSALVLGGILTACPPTRKHTRLIWSAIALNGFALAVIGAGFHFADATKLLGFMDAPASYFFATFFYKNHWAAYGALCASAGLALALEALPGALRGKPRAGGRVLLFISTALLTLITLPLPGSRSGVLLACCLLVGALGVGFRLFMCETHKTLRIHWPSLIAMILLGLSILAYGVLAYAKTAKVDFARTKHQIDSANRLEDVETRILLSRDTWHMAMQQPWFGWGPGSFEIVFPVFQGDYMRNANGLPSSRVKEAHNDWLQQFAETGVIGLCIFLPPLVITGMSGWRRAGPAARWALGAGCLLLLYALIDFPLHNPAVLIVLTILWTTAGRLGETKDRGIEIPRTSP